MSKIRIRPGVRFRLREEWFVIRELLLNKKILLESQSFGGKSVKSLEELESAISSGELRFEIIGPHRKIEDDKSIPIDYTIKDFETLPEGVREEAWRVYDLIRPILRWDDGERTRKNIEKYVNEIRAKRGVSIDVHQRDKKNSPRKGVKRGQALSRAFIERKLNSFLKSGCDIRALVDGSVNIGNPGTRRLDENIDNVISNVLDNCAKDRHYRTVESVYLNVVNEIAKENRFLAPGMKLGLPSRDTVYRRIRERGAKNILYRVLSRLEQHANEPVQEAPRPTRIMELVEFDGTELDLIVVDEEDRLPVGRPWFSYALDKYSGYPLGFYLGFDPPSYLTTMRCALHAFAIKPDARTLYGTKNGWLSRGLPEWSIIDNGPEYTNRDLETSFGMIGVPYDQAPVKTPWMKGSVERFFRTQNTGLIHMLPGTTFSNIVSRGDYPSENFACISLSRLIQIMHIFLLDYYSERLHEGVKGIPAQLWRQSEQEGFYPCYPASQDELKILLFCNDTRTLQRIGIEYETIIYYSDELLRLRTLMPKGNPKVHIRINPDDISHIYVLDPITKQEWLRFNAVDPTGYTKGLSLWKHHVILKIINRQKRKVDIFALADAKARIQQIVEEEYLLKKKLRRRKTAARYLSTPPSSALPAKVSSGGMGLAPETDDIQSDAEIVDAEVEEVKPIPPKKSRQGDLEGKPLTSTSRQSPILDDDDDIDTSGWISDFNLPQNKSNRIEGE